MSIETRIKKIESGIKTGGEFCHCVGDPRYPRTETIYHENGKPATCPNLTNQTLPDVCQSCGKAIHKMAIIIDFIDAPIPKPEGAK